MAIVFMVIAIVCIILLFIYDSKRDKRMEIHESFQDEIYVELERYKKENKKMLNELRECVAVIELLLAELKKPKKKRVKKCQSKR